jgi:hypothetical protein
MKLGFLLLSDHSESINGKIYAMGAGWNQLRFPELPQEFGFSIALGLDVPWDETNRQHKMTLHIEDPDGERLGDEFSSRTAFSNSGPHAVIVKVNGKEIDRARFYVMEVPPEMLAQQ